MWENKGLDLVSSATCWLQGELQPASCSLAKIDPLQPTEEWKGRVLSMPVLGGWIKAKPTAYSTIKEVMDVHVSPYADLLIHEGL